MKRMFLKEIRTECGLTFNIRAVDQIAIGILETEKTTGKEAFVPDTYSLYKAGGNQFVLEITTYEAEKNLLNTTYKLLPEAKAMQLILHNKLA